MRDLIDIVKKHALINAILHDGKADRKAVFKKLLGEVPELKELVKNKEKRDEIMNMVNNVLNEVNSLTKSQQLELLSKKYGIMLEDIMEERSKKTREGLPPLPEVDKVKTVVTRFAPAPSGALHLGQILRAAFLSYFYAKMYNGKFILRLEDTDPKRIKRIYYDLIMQDLKSVGIKWDELVYESDHFDIYYELTRQLFEKKLAYVCTCTSEEFKQYREKRKPCPHRDSMDHVENWEEMINGKYREGEAVVRLKTDMNHPNPALRDPPLLRIIESVPHPRTGYKYRVYPLYNYACAIEDHLSGVTYVIRGKEHETNEAIQREIYKAFGWTPPITIQYGMLRLPELKMHKRHIRRSLREGSLDGWDDVTLPTIRALIRRGIHPKAIEKMAFHVGMTKSDATVSLETLYAFNRQVLSPIARRISFVEDPFKLKITNIPKKHLDVKMAWIPEKKDAGFRYYKLGISQDGATNVLYVYLSSSDKDLLNKAMRNKEPVRLKDLMNIVIEKIDMSTKEILSRFHSFELIPRIIKLHWVPFEPLCIASKVIMPNGEIKTGLVEYYAQELKIGEFVQMERFGFGRVDRNEGELIVFTYAHP